MATALKLSALPLLIGLIMASLLVMMLRRPRHRKQTFSWSPLLPVVIVLVCENRAFFDVHEHREGVLERHLFGKAVLIQAITPASSLPLGYENLEPVLLDYRNQAQPVCRGSMQSADGVVVGPYISRRVRITDLRNLN